MGDNHTNYMMNMCSFCIHIQVRYTSVNADDQICCVMNI